MAKKSDLVIMTEKDHSNLMHRQWMTGAMVGAVGVTVISIIINLFFK